jgi:hypothetical protein
MTVLCVWCGVVLVCYIPGAPYFARVAAPTNGLQYSYKRRKPSASVATILLAPTIMTGCLAANDTRVAVAEAQIYFIFNNTNKGVMRWGDVMM